MKVAREGLIDLGKCCPDDGVSFFIKSSPDLQVIRTAIKSWKRLILGQIGMFTRELFAI